jgi:hypothetical protein
MSYDMYMSACMYMSAFMYMSACMYMSRGMGVRGLAGPAMLDTMIDVDLVLAHEHQIHIHGKDVGPRHAEGAGAGRYSR